jgi:eukaryotic-like serine/threonine-protein kinase
MDLTRGISTRFTFVSGDRFPVWSPDGNRVAFGSTRGGPRDIYQKPSNGGGDEQLLLKSDDTKVPHSWSGDGRFLMFGEGSVSEASEWVLPLDKDAHASGKPFLFVQKGVGFEQKFSPGPQGHPLWVAYSSSESGRYEIYVRPFDPNSPTGTPSVGGKWQVSTQGGMSARWNSNGKELFYIAPDSTVMSVDVSGTATTFQSGTPKPLFKPKGLAQQAAEYFNWDASSDGKKFIFAISQSSNVPAPPARFTVVLNWTSLLKK